MVCWDFTSIRVSAELQFNLFLLTKVILATWHLGTVSARVSSPIEGHPGNMASRHYIGRSVWVYGLDTLDIELILFRQFMTSF